MQNDRNHEIADRRKPRDESRGLSLGLILVALLVFGQCCWAAEEVVTPVEKPGLYDVDASGADLKFVLEALARRSGANLVVSPEITGEVTVHLKQMAVDSILECLAQVQGFAWKNEGGAYLIASQERFAAPPPPAPEPPPAPQPETLVWVCRHITASDVIPMIEKLFPDIKIAEGPTSSTPTLAGGSKSVTGEGGSSGSSSDSEQTKAESTRIVLIGLPDEIAKTKSLLEKLDVPRPQIAVDVKIMEIAENSDHQLGIDWSWSDVVLQESAPHNGIRFGKFTKQGMTFTGALSAMFEDGSASLLAQPNISVLDNECADILIGDRILFPKLVGYTQFGTPMYDKDEERVGIYLQIAPRVTSDDEIVLSLYPQVSLVTDYLRTQAGDYPQISTREARTTVSVKNDTTLAIGGLVRNDEIVNASKVPLLGDLPIIGQFFRHSKKTNQRTEIVIFLTPKIVKES